MSGEIKLSVSQISFIMNDILTKLTKYLRDCKLLLILHPKQFQ